MSTGSVGLKMLKAVAAKAKKGMDENDIKKLEKQFQGSFPSKELDVRHAAYMLQDLYIDKREWSEIVSRYGLNSQQQAVFKQSALKKGIRFKKSGKLFTEANFLRCHELYNKSLFSHVAANECTWRAKLYNYLSQSFNTCYRVYSASLFSNVAADRCEDLVSSGEFVFADDSIKKVSAK